MGLESKIGQKLRPVALWTHRHTHRHTHTESWHPPVKTPAKKFWGETCAKNSSKEIPGGKPAGTVTGSVG